MIQLFNPNYQFKPTMAGEQEVVLVSIQETMYDSTPSLALDELVYQGQRECLGWGFTAIEVIVGSEGDELAQVHHKTRDGWEDKPELRDLWAVLNEYDPLIVGFSVTSKNCVEMFRYLSRREELSQRLVIAGGIHPKVNAMETVQDAAFIDLIFGIQGLEGFSYLLNNPQEWRETPGILTKADEESFRSNGLGKKRVFPIVPATHQRQAKWDDQFIYRLQTAKGCTYPCNFCALDKKFTPKSVEEVKDYLDSVVEDIKRREISQEEVLVFIENGNFGGPKGRMMYQHATKLLDLFSQYNLNFGIQVKYDNLTEEYTQRLKEGNVKYILTSIESTNSQVLKGMNKGQKGDEEEIYKVFKRLQDAGIDYGISIIRGMPGDKQKYFEDTVHFAKVLTPKIICTEIAKVFPGTRLVEEYENKNGQGTIRFAYITGIGLAHDMRLGPENRGTLLLIPEEEGVIALEAARDIICGDQIKDEFKPLSSANYVQVHPGFFRREKKITSD